MKSQCDKHGCSELLCGCAVEVLEEKSKGEVMTTQQSFREISCEMETRNGIKFTVSKEDFESVNKHKWTASKRPVSCKFPRNTGLTYIFRRLHIVGSRSKYRVIYLHRQIIDAKKGQIVDHINHDSTDNRRENLRFATQSQNTVHSKKPTTSCTGYRGVVHSRSRKGYFSVQIVKDKKKHEWHGFKTSKDAALFYDGKAFELYGEFAPCNFPKLARQCAEDLREIKG